MAQLLVSRHGQTLPEDARQKIDRIIHNAGVGGQLIGELLELSRLKSKPINAENVDLGQMIKNLALLFESDLRNKSIELQFDPQLPSVLGDPSRLRQLFQNLIDNAIKYMGDSKKRCIEVLGTSVPGGTEITVSDSGPGIPVEDRQRVFCVFRRGTQAGSVPGKGVGLSWVKSIMELHGGTIELGASAMGGCGFRLFFPNSDALATNNEAATSSPTDSAEVESGAKQTPVKLDAA
jgi:signal transduction histidine kinase